MHALSSPTTQVSLETHEPANQHEACERAGLEAHARGLLRHMNPYVRLPGVAATEEPDPRLQALAEQWWRGWDSWGPGVGRRHHG